VKQAHREQAEEFVRVERRRRLAGLGRKAASSLVHLAAITSGFQAVSVADATEGIRWALVALLLLFMALTVRRDI
jgi:hypothetical protein